MSAICVHFLLCFVIMERAIFWAVWASDANSFNHVSIFESELGVVVFGGWYVLIGWFG